jgi:plasmid maintenance system killer protein
MKVRSIAHKRLRRLYEDNSSKDLSADTVDKLRKMLAFLDAMQDPEQLRALPTWKAHILAGDARAHGACTSPATGGWPSGSRTTRSSTSTLRTTTERANDHGMDTLMRMQAAYDIARARKDAGKIHVRRYQPGAAHGWIRGARSDHAERRTWPRAFATYGRLEVFGIRRESEKMNTSLPF